MLDAVLMCREGLVQSADRVVVDNVDTHGFAVRDGEQWPAAPKLDNISNLKL